MNGPTDKVITVVQPRKNWGQFNWRKTFDYQRPASTVETGKQN